MNPHKQHNDAIRRDYGVEEVARGNMDELKFFHGAKYAIPAGLILWGIAAWSFHKIAALIATSAWR